MLAKPDPVSGPAPMPLIPHQLRRIQISVLEVIGAILDARLHPELRLNSIYFVECIVFRLASALHYICCYLQPSRDTLHFKTMHLLDRYLLHALLAAVVLFFNYKTGRISSKSLRQ